MAKHTPDDEQRRLVATWRDSGDSMAAFARARGLRPATFASWVARHPRADPTGNVPSFLPVRIAHAPDDGLRVALAGVQLAFVHPPPPAWFAAVLRELAPC